MSWGIISRLVVNCDQSIYHRGGGSHCSKSHLSALSFHKNIFSSWVFFLSTQQGESETHSCYLDLQRAERDHRLHLVCIPLLDFHFSRLQSRPSSRSVFSSNPGLLSVSETLHQAALALARRPLLSSRLRCLCRKQPSWLTRYLLGFVTDATKRLSKALFSLRLASVGLKASRLKVDKLRRQLKHWSEWKQQRGRSL